MARIVRPMKKDPADPKKPLVAPRFCCLGVRLHEVTLIPPGNPAGQVQADGMGMSVSADWRNLGPELIPEELEDDENGDSRKKDGGICTRQWDWSLCRSPRGARSRNALQGEQD